MRRMPLPWKKNSKPKKASPAPAELLSVALPEDAEARSESSLISTPCSSASSSRSSSLQSNEPQYSIGTPEWFLRSKVEFESKWANTCPKTRSTTIHDFQLHRKLATGCFGPIVLVQHRATREFYALKVLEKRLVVQRSQVDKALTEKRILETTNFPFLVGLHFSCQDASNLYLVMDYVGGADLWSLLQRQRQRLSNRRHLIIEPHARFYVPQILLALEYLHYLDFVYRDLKPENILIDSNGYLKLADFGYTKRLSNDKRLRTFCGTQDYIAPEIILGKPYGKAVDYWSLGILIFEMVTGVTPFYNKGENKMLTYECIVSGRFKEPSYASKELKDLLRKLIQVDLTRRIGCLKGGVAEVKAHPWFNALKWTDILLKKTPPPYIPKLSHAGDARYFSAESQEGNNNDFGFVAGRRDSHPVVEDPYAKLFIDF